MNIRATLQRTEKGLFRPNLPQPETTHEAAVYTADLEAAASADQLLDKFEKMMSGLPALDNSEQDLNSDAGRVVTAGAANTSNNDTLIESSALIFDQATGKVETFEREVEGHAVLEHTGFLSTFKRSYAYAPVTQRQTYIAGPLLSLTTDSTTQNPGSPKRARAEHESLTQLSSGLFEYEYTLADNLKMRVGF